MDVSMDVLTSRSCGLPTIRSPFAPGRCGTVPTGNLSGPMTIRDTRRDDSHAATERPAAVPAPVGIRSGYQPALDGVRAIAVLIVIKFHTAADGGLAFLAGGWLGVDVFFVLSGYLITSLLLSEHRRNGRIDLKRFYVRRLLRLAPLSVALVLVLWAGMFFELDARLGLSLEFSGGVSILAYYSNWWTMWHPGSLGSLGHAWSLSIEEQFYFVWPWVVVGAFFLARRRARGVVIVFTAAAVVTIGLVRRQLWYRWTGPGTIGDDAVDAWLGFFRNSFLRGDAILYGCLLALVLHGVRSTPTLRRIVAVVAVPAIVGAVVIVGKTYFKMWQPWVDFIPAWGLSLFGLCVTTGIAWLVVAPGTLFARFLSLRPLVWVGRRAYGIYLFHPLVIAVVLHRTSLTRLPFEITVFGVTLILSGLSFRFFETPFLRLKERFSSR